MFDVACPEPSFDVPELGWFTDSSKHMFGPDVFALTVETGLARSHTTESPTVIGKDLACLRVFTYRLVEEPDDVICVAVSEDLAARVVPGVVVQDGDESLVVHQFEISLP